MTTLGNAGPTGSPAAPEPKRRLTPRQARRIRAITAAVAMVAVGVGMVVRFAAEPSLLTLALYGAALTLCGTAIMLSRAGRTRVAMGVLAIGAALVAVDPLLQ
jgi:hypothetical protein